MSRWPAQQRDCLISIFLEPVNLILDISQTIAAVATALLQVAQPEFKEYARQVIANAKTLGSALIEHGYKLQTGGTDNHLVLWDLRPLRLTGSKVEKVCDLLGITINSMSLYCCILGYQHVDPIPRKCCIW